MNGTGRRSGWLTRRFFAASLLFWFVVTWLGLWPSLEWVERHLEHASLGTRMRFVWTWSAPGVVPRGLLTPFLFDFAWQLGRRRLGGAAIALRSLVVLVLVSVVSVLLMESVMGNGWRWSPQITWRISEAALSYAAILGTAFAVDLYRRAEQRRGEALQAQLRALRSQLQPHFLFNTLQAIGSTARTDGPLAARLTTLLGDLLRQSLRESHGSPVALADELRLLEPYLELQRLRFADRLTIDVDVPDELLRAAVPDLLLQPLVENALQHGIERRPGPGRVAITARRRQGLLELTVRDDGDGVERDVDDGVGLGTTRRRLEVLYGDRAELLVAPADGPADAPSAAAADGAGTVAIVRLPFEEHRDAD